jgi:hypothetical protein
MTLAASLFALAVLSASPDAREPIVADRAPTVSNVAVAEYLEFHDEVARRAAGGEFRELSATDRGALAEAQARIRAAVAGKANMGELSEAERLQVFNDHQRVVALVDRAEESRVVCEQVKRVGSHRHAVECRSVAEVRRARERAQIEGRAVRQWPY